MSKPTNPLDYLREAKRGLTSEQQSICDDFVISILSLHAPEQVWRDAVDTAVRLVTIRGSHRLGKGKQP